MTDHVNVIGVTGVVALANGAASRQTLPTKTLSEMFEQIAPMIEKYSDNLAKLAYCCHCEVADEDDLARRIVMIDELFNCAQSENDLPAIFAHVISSRVYDYEQATVELPTVTPAEALAHFMAENNLKQRDLSEVASQSIISEILHGKRKMTVGHIKGFARFFGVPEQTFMG